MPINITDSAGAGINNTNNIVDSSKPGFESTYNIQTPQNSQNSQNSQDINESKIDPLTGKPNLAMDISARNLKIPKLNDIVKDVKQNKVTEQDSIQAANTFKLLLNTQLKPFNAQDFTPGSMLFYRYDAKNKLTLETWDRSPLVFILRRSRGYILTINLHYVPINLRLIFIKYFLQMNKQNIRQNMPLTLSYQMIKPVLQKLGMMTTIKLHIFGRISRRGVVIPPEFMTSAAKLKAESFTNGISAEQLYRQSIQQAKTWKQNRGRHERVAPHVYKK
jgi:hypothetical protein